MADGIETVQSDDAGIGDPVLDDAAQPRIVGGLLDPKTFPSAWGQQAAGGDVSIDAFTPASVGPLNTDIDAQVERDIQTAQAKLTPQNPDQVVFGGRIYSVLNAKTFDPTRSNGATVWPGPEAMDIANMGQSNVAVPYGTEEKMGYVVSFPVAPSTADADPRTGLATAFRTQPIIVPWAGTTRQSDKADTVGSYPPLGALAGIHGHIDDGPPGYQDNGMVDEPKANEGYGDASSLRGGRPLPMATVSNGQVGWHVIDNGQLKFLYPRGSMTPEQTRQMQQNLDQEQQKFLRPK